MKKVTVILGAGASYDVHNPSVPIRSDTARPPLAKELFEPRFYPQRERYPGAVIIGSQLGAIASGGGPFDLEEQLTRYAESANPETVARYREVPAYLRDVLVHCAENYVPTPATYNQLVARLLEPMTHEVMFLVLNYDTLLERALRTYDNDYTFNRMNDYISDPWVKVVKVHGSTDWLVPIPGPRRSASSWIQAARAYSPQPSHISHVQIFDQPSATANIELVVNDSVYHGYPWLTAPVRGKTLRCPDSHRAVMRAFIMDCHKFLIVGTSGLDEDLLEAIAEGINPQQKYLVQYVDYVGTPARERFETVIPEFRLGANGGPVPRTYEEGFRRFLVTNELEAFLEAD